VEGERREIAGWRGKQGAGEAPLVGPAEVPAEDIEPVVAAGQGRDGEPVAVEGDLLAERGHARAGGGDLAGRPPLAGTALVAIVNADQRRGLRADRETVRIVGKVRNHALLAERDERPGIGDGDLLDHLPVDAVVVENADELAARHGAGAAGVDQGDDPFALEGELGGGLQGRQDGAAGEHPVPRAAARVEVDLTRAGDREPVAAAVHRRGGESSRQGLHR
jgi:hypothetical protein